jgi:N-acetylglucosaminyl-diphospho-decaprenol L-rhamnosyltransferase
MMADLSIIIVNWNSKEYVRRCIASICRNPPGLACEIVVVDSGSFDGCAEMLRQLYPRVRFIQSNTNLGFGRASNLGARQALGEVLLMLNPDTEIGPGGIDRLYAAMRQLPDAGAVGCRLLNADGSLQTSCVQPFPTIANQVLTAQALQRRFPGVRLWTTAGTYAGASGPVEVEAVSGACMMIKREVFERLDGFSAEYFMYTEDLDLCYKARVAGFVNYHVPTVEILHHGGGTTGHSRFATVMKHESVGRMLRKTHGPRYRAIYQASLTGAAAARLAVLGLMLPVKLVQGRTMEWRAACAKWIAVLRWGLGLEGWVRQYDHRVTCVQNLAAGSGN